MNENIEKSTEENNKLEEGLTYKQGETVIRSIVDEMKANYLDYSMSVNVSRALPEVRDGLKPSQRRILIAMNDLNLLPTAHYRKSAKIAGDTSGNYHPHGESVVYPTLVKMAQDFSTRYPLIDGQGNFGSIDGDSAAAMRYTEARMAKITPALLTDLNKGTVTYISNYDGTKLEPTVLPTLFPNVLANGSDGIAVAMATKIPPHNLTELIDALQKMISLGNKWEGTPVYNDLRKKKEAKEEIPSTLNPKPIDYLENYIEQDDINLHHKIDELKAELKKKGLPLYPEFKSDITPSELIEIIPGPDFPTGGTIYDQKEILNAYATGRGRILGRAKASIVEGSNSRYNIVITEIPYQVNKAHMIEKIADLVKDKKIKGIADIRDESNREGMRLVIILKRDAQPKAVLNKLFKYTEMQKVFNANMIALVNQEPKTLPLRKFLELFLSFRLIVTIRRYEFDLAEAKFRGHILEGLLKALDMLDEVIDTIRKSKSQDTAKTNLMDKFGFTEVQAQAILDMQLRRLAALERMKIQNEFKEIKAKIKEYNEILESQERVLDIVNKDLEAIKEKYGDERRTKVVKGKIDEISEEDMVASEDTLVTITRSGYVKRVPPNTYRSQHRGGKGVSGGEAKEGDFIEHAFLCNTHDELLLFTNMGKVYNLRIFEIPELSRIAKGLPLVNLVQLDQDEIVTSVLTRNPKGEISEEEEKEKVYKYFLMVTENGTVKKTKLEEFKKIRSNGLTAIKLEVGDQLIWVKPTTGNDEVIVVTRNGKSIRFKETDVRSMGRSTKGVKGISFKDETDCVIGMGIVKSEEQRLLTLSEFGYGKMSLLKEYTAQKRGGSGIFTFRITEKTGRVASARLLTEKEDEIVVISEKSKVIRADLKSVPVQGRQTSGVKVMNINKGDRVVTVALL